MPLASALELGMLAGSRLYAASSLFSNLEPGYQVVLFLLAGRMAFSGHSAKAATRLPVNHSPEPFSNIAVSLGEDAFVAGGLYMAVKHPWAMAGIALAFLGLFAWLAPRIYRPPQLTAAQQRSLTRKWGRSVARKISPVVAIEPPKGLLLDELVLVAGDGLRIRFDLLGGQMESARSQAKRYSPPSPRARSSTGDSTPDCEPGRH